MPLTFGVTDPYWQERQLDRTTETLSFLRSLVEQKRAKKERRLQQDLNNFLRVADRSPGAAVKMGQDIQEKYGERAPDLSPFLNSLTKAGERAEQIKGAGKKWLGRTDELRQGYGDEAEKLLGQAMHPGLAPQAREAAARKLQEIASKSPDALYGEAAREMKPSERARANIWARSKYLPFPEPQDPDQFDPGDLPADLRALYEAQPGRGITDEELREAARIKAKTEPSPYQERSLKQRERGQDLRSRGLDISALRERRLAEGKEEEEDLTPYQKRRLRERRVKGIQDSLLESTEILAKEDEDRRLPQGVGEVKRLLPRHARKISDWIDTNAESLAEGDPQAIERWAYELETRLIDRYKRLLRMGVDRNRAIEIIMKGEEDPKDFPL